MSAAPIAMWQGTGRRAARAAQFPLLVLHALVSRPALLFLAALTVILFRPPDLQIYEMDRIAVLALAYFVVLRALVRRQRFRVLDRVSLPLLGLVTLGFCRVIAQPYNAESWSVFAAKWLVPFLLFHLAGHVFEDEISMRKFEIFCWIVLAYLSVIAVLFLLGWKTLIFPRFIMDASIGIHAERARGPFLQAVANGVALNLLALIAIDSFRRRRLPRLLAAAFFALLPFAILATKTRAAWLSFALSIGALAVISRSRRIRRACLCGLLVGAVGLSVALATMRNERGFRDRFEEASPVEFRMALYQAGWDLFRERPLLGWNAAEIQEQLEQRIQEFHQEAFYFHNTFLEVAVAYGCVGLGLYLWLVIDLLLLTRRRFPSKSYSGSGGFLDGDFRSLWPMLLFVYLLNACFVVMNYQFVNGLIFSIAGMLAAQDHRLKHGLRRARALFGINSFGFQQT